MYERDLVFQLRDRLEEPRHFMQIVIGPRQTGKSTAVSQALSTIKVPIVEFSFDKPMDCNIQKLEEVWDNARVLIKEADEVILSLDEIQKVENWSSGVKYLWDGDTKNKRNIKVVLTGSSALNLQTGMAESLKGRFEELISTHWTYSECKEAFDYTFDQFLFYGGYPGSSLFINDEERWFSYMHSSIINPTLNQDVLSLENIRKPALLRALFEIGALYSSQEISYRKILGQLDDKGNTETISHYLTLLSNAGVLTGLKKYDNKLLVTKTSSPRLMVHDTSLLTATLGEESSVLLENKAQRGRLVESAVGAYLIGRARKERFSLNWWRDRNAEVDFVVSKGRKRTAIEVKSGRVKNLNGLGEFTKRFPGTYSLIVGSNEFPLESFLLGEVPLFQ